MPEPGSRVGMVATLLRHELRQLLRDRRTTASELDNIPGIGPTKKLALLHHFGSVARIRAATAEELAEVRGLNRHDLVVIREYFAKQT